MALSRDVGVLTVAAWARPGDRLLDGLAGVGARGVRYALESMPKGEGAVVLNDRNAEASALARENARRNDVATQVVERSLGSLLWEGTWNIIDIDPFGSPAPFLEAATRAVAPGGLLAITATDTGALFGTYPTACRRRYAAEPLRCEFGHELALRILAGRIAQAAAAHDVAATPVLAHAAGHAYRVYAAERPGAGPADRALQNLGFAFLCGTCGHRGVERKAPDGAPPAGGCPLCGGARAWAGPLWVDAMLDSPLLARLSELSHGRELAQAKETGWLLTLLMGEADMPALFYDAHEAASDARVDPWPISALLDALFKNGYRAARTHLTPTGIKTDANRRELLDVMRGDRDEVYRLIDAFERRAETEKNGAR
jgi:tRNA (guanine26-N2/guanine27-N2)-dimethyltransferase